MAIWRSNKLITQRNNRFIAWSSPAWCCLYLLVGYSIVQLALFVAGWPLTPDWPGSDWPGSGGGSPTLGRFPLAEPLAFAHGMLR
jgi:hypothetical protein